MIYINLYFAAIKPQLRHAETTKENTEYAPVSDKCILLNILYLNFTLFISMHVYFNSQYASYSCK